MTLKDRQLVRAYAIVRIDHFLRDLDSEDEPESLRKRIKVTKVVLDEIVAQTEVDRLNELNPDKGCTYFFQSTKILQA